MELNRALEILEYNKAMLTCDMSISRDPERQDVSPDYYGKEAEDLYNAIVCVEKYIKKAISVEWLNKRAEEIAFAYWTNARNKVTLPLNELPLLIDQIIGEWEKENALDKQIEKWEIDDDVDWEMIQNGEITD